MLAVKAPDATQCSPTHVCVSAVAKAAGGYSRTRGEWGVFLHPVLRDRNLPTSGTHGVERPKSPGGPHQGMLRSHCVVF